MSKKIVHELSIEDLVRLATGSDEPVVMDGLTEAAKFIYELGIKHGDDRIPAELIYHTYKQWRGHGQKYQPRPYFFRDFKKFFTQCRTTDGMAYLLHSKPFDLSSENYWLVRKSLRDERSQKVKKAKRQSS